MTSNSKFFNETVYKKVAQKQKQDETTVQIKETEKMIYGSLERMGSKLDEEFNKIRNEIRETSSKNVYDLMLKHRQLEKKFDNSFVVGMLVLAALIIASIFWR
jgi:hypothetical protein